jgi:hypothetical protein
MGIKNVQELERSYTVLLYEVRQFSSRNGPVKAKFAY